MFLCSSRVSYREVAGDYISETPFKFPFIPLYQRRGVRNKPVYRLSKQDDLAELVFLSIILPWVLFF